MIDLLLVFPPQWSPFQPPLSLPSLAAWLKRAGFQVGCLDANICFYEWLFSDNAVQILLDKLPSADLPDSEKDAYVHALRSTEQYRADICALRPPAPDATWHLRGDPTAERIFDVAQNYASVKSLSNYLWMVSRICRNFEISCYEFRLSTGNVSSLQLEKLVANPDALLEGFAQHLLREIVARYSDPPELIGLSCIGQEQLYFTLLLGNRIRQAFGARVLVGGTIFSRIFERGALKNEWFGKFFDVIVRNEGERPTEQMLINSRDRLPLLKNVPSVVYVREGTVVSNAPCCPLKPAEMPIPDFDDMPLGRYFSSDVTLPVLSSRGCYWGKCEFCHHGMVYGEKYAAYAIDGILSSVATLSKRYGVRHFAFNDEAIPPKVARAIAETFPPSSATGWNFTGLIKFERYYDFSIFAGLARIGMRSLYVGLESASERVLALMRKNTKKEIIIQNLRDATRAGIWMHCFLFFGFPGEREEDARETYDFIMSNSDIITSFGCGTFSLEHNAPIQKHSEDLGILVAQEGSGDLDVYYTYTVKDGMGADRAMEWAEALNQQSSEIPKYAAVSWVPREHLLCLLSRNRPEELVDASRRLLEEGAVPLDLSASHVFSLVDDFDVGVLINRLSGGFFGVPSKLLPMFRTLCESAATLRELRQYNPAFFARIGV